MNLENYKVEEYALVFTREFVYVGLVAQLG
jgi:hypothetical protein